MTSLINTSSEDVMCNGGASVEMSDRMGLTDFELFLHMQRMERYHLIRTANESTAASEKSSGRFPARWMNETVWCTKHCQ